MKHTFEFTCLNQTLMNNYYHAFNYKILTIYIEREQGCVMKCSMNIIIYLNYVGLQKYLLQKIFTKYVSYFFKNTLVSVLMNFAFLLNILYDRGSL